MVRTVLADVLLGLAAAVVLASSAGILVMRDTYQKIHYVTPAALVAPVLVGLAVLARSGWNVTTGQTWLTVVLMAVAGPYLAHATLRAARAREQHAGQPPQAAAGGSEDAEPDRT